MSTTVTPSSLISAVLPQNFYAKFLKLVAELKITTTSWEPGDPTRTTLVYLAQVLGIGFGTAQTNAFLPAPDPRDSVVVNYAMGGLLLFASAVTPDPSVALADGTYPAFGRGFLDSIADGIFNVQRTGGPNGGNTSQTNASLVDACLAKLQADGTTLAEQGIDPYVYYTTTKYAGAALTTPITRVAVISNPATAVVDLYLANATTVAPAGDVQAVHDFLQTRVVPWAVTLVVHPAQLVGCIVDLDVYVPARYAALAGAAVQQAIEDFINAVPVGGLPGAVGGNGIPLAAVIAAIFDAVPYVEDVENFTINTLSTDQILTVSQCAVMAPAPLVRVHST